MLPSFAVTRNDMQECPFVTQKANIIELTTRENNDLDRFLMLKYLLRSIHCIGRGLLYPELCDGLAIPRVLARWLFEG
jgi:hypothetical protein